MTTFHTRRGELWYLYSQEINNTEVVGFHALKRVHDKKDTFSGSRLFKIKQMDQDSFRLCWSFHFCRQQMLWKDMPIGTLD